MLSAIICLLSFRLLLRIRNKYSWERGNFHLYIQMWWNIIIDQSMRICFVESFMCLDDGWNHEIHHQFVWLGSGSSFHLQFSGRKPIQFYRTNQWRLWSSYWKNHPVHLFCNPTEKHDGNCENLHRCIVRPPNDYRSRWLIFKKKGSY